MTGWTCNWWFTKSNFTKGLCLHTHKKTNLMPYDYEYEYEYDTFRHKYDRSFFVKFIFSLNRPSKIVHTPCNLFPHTQADILQNSFPFHWGHCLYTWPGLDQAKPDRIWRRLAATGWSCSAVSSKATKIHLKGWNFTFNFSLLQGYFSQRKGRWNIHFLILVY
jgi:hypothetical protein